jgi:hypothetical protein
VATWTVRGILTKELDLTEETEERNISIIVITETRIKLKGT